MPARLSRLLAIPTGLSAAVALVLTAVLPAEGSSTIGPGPNQPPPHATPGNQIPAPAGAFSSTSAYDFPVNGLVTCTTTSSSASGISVTSTFTATNSCPTTTSSSSTILGGFVGGSGLGGLVEAAFVSSSSSSSSSRTSGGACGTDGLLTTGSVTLPDGTIVGIQVPAGAVSANTAVDVYQVADQTKLTHLVPAGQQYEYAFAVGFEEPDGIPCIANAPFVVTVRNTTLGGTQTVYETTPTALTPVPAGDTGVVVGSLVTLGFTHDPGFVITTAVPAGTNTTAASTSTFQPPVLSTDTGAAAATGVIPAGPGNTGGGGTALTARPLLGVAGAGLALLALVMVTAAPRRNRR